MFRLLPFGFISALFPSFSLGAGDLDFALPPLLKSGRAPARGGRRRCRSAVSVVAARRKARRKGARRSRRRRAAPC